MEPDEIEIARALGNVSFLPGSWNKRFAGSLISQAKYNPEKALTSSQREWLFRLLYTYRKQIPVVYEKYQDNPLCNKLTK